MMIQKTQKRAEISKNRYRYRVVITGFPCPPGSPEVRIQQYNILRQISNEPHLLLCGTQLPDRITVKHDGEGWTVEAEAEVEEVPVLE